MCDDSDDLCGALGAEPAAEALASGISAITDKVSRVVRVESKSMKRRTRDGIVKDR